MRSLTVRLVVSHLLLAVLALGGAGMLLEALLAPLLTRYDLAEMDQRLDDAARGLAVSALLREITDPEALTREAQLGIPTATVERIDGMPDWRLLHQLAEFNYGVRDDGKGIPSALAERAVWLQTRAYRVFGQPEIRIVTQQQAENPVAHYRLTWHGDQSLRLAAMRRALMGAFLLALAVAGVASVWLGRTLSRPLNRMAAAAGQVAAGKWDAPLPSDGPVEVRQLSAAFAQMAERLGAEFARVRGEREKLEETIAEVAHELKTPIASLRTYHELLLDGVQEMPESRQRLLERGAAQVRRLEYLTQFLVDMAKLESHAAPLNLAEVKVVALVADAVAGAQVAAEARGVAVRLVEAPTAGSVMALADPQRLGQALDNLLQNAIRWSEAGGEVRVSVDGGAVTVEDDGPGIAADVLPRLFTPFAKGAGSTGLGLGLAIVRAVAESHGGSVRAENRPEGGATFRLELPVEGGGAV
jgi:signal transduction histidine kinase